MSWDTAQSLRKEFLAHIQDAPDMDPVDNGLRVELLAFGLATLSPSLYFELYRNIQPRQFSLLFEQIPANPSKETGELFK